MANAIRFRFSRGEELKFIAHLDVLRLFERAIKRSGLPIAYTQGFNPRQKLVFGLPMPVGLTSSAEYADAEFDQDISPGYFIETLNKSLPEGIRVLDAVILKCGETVMSQIASARYEISVKAGEDVGLSVLESKIHAFLDMDEIMVKKKTKKGLRPVNIKPLIYSLSVVEGHDGHFTIRAFLCAGSGNNLRPDLLMEAFIAHSGLDLRVCSLHRKELYASSLNEWKNPLEVANG
jgi:radical SAM-linked protein